MPYDPGTYSPGDPWLEPEYATRAPTAPRITSDATANSEATTGSYFYMCPHRDGHPRQVQVGVRRSVGASAFEVVLERLYPGELTWRPDRSFTAETELSIDYTAFYKLRLRVVSIGAGNTLQLSLIQHL